MFIRKISMSSSPSYTIENSTRVGRLPSTYRRQSLVSVSPTDHFLTSDDNDMVENGESNIDDVTAGGYETSLPFHTEDEFTDVILVVEGRQLFTNRSLLAFASPVFSCMFTAEFREKSEKVDHEIKCSYIL